MGFKEDVPDRATQSGSATGPSPTADEPHAELLAVARPRTFAHGEIVADRYRVETFLAAGGMGEVYEATDLELRQRIALKTLRRERKDEPNAIERLRREIAYARRVTHPNVARIFDVGFHVGTDSTIFLTMELLSGEPLSERIAREGALARDQALPIVDQLCAALDAAHEAGVIHRDFKSSNVMLVRREGEAPRAVVTDFGIARAAEDEDANRLSREGALVGSPAYMAPEQVKGEETSFATDVYALGVVLFEMTTGALPFVGETSAATALMRVSTEAPRARTKKPELPLAWDDVIARCLRKAPRDRFASAGEVARALRRPARRRWRRPAAIAMAIVATLGAGATVAAKWPAPPISVVEGRRPNVVVLPFAEEGGATTSAALTELMATELGVGETVRVRPTQDVARMARELGIAPGIPDAAMRAKIRRYSGADFAVTGRVHAERAEPNAPVRVEVTVVDLASGASRTEKGLNGSVDALPELVARAGGPLRRRLNQPELLPEEAALARAMLPRSRDAARAYAAAIQANSRYAFSESLARLHEAITADPDFALAHFALSNVATHLAYEAEAAREAERAVALSTRLPREQRLLFQAQLAVATKKWADAAEIQRTLHGFFPDEVEYAVRYAIALAHAGKADEGLRVSADARKLPRTDSDDAHLDLLDAFLHARLGHHKERMAAALEAARKSEELGATLMRAEALLHVAEVHFNLRELDVAAETAQQVLTLYGDGSGDPLGYASALLTLGRVEMDRGRPDDAEKTLTRAVKIIRGLGDKYQLAIKLGWLAKMQLARGHIALARRNAEEARALFTDVASKDGVAAALDFDAEASVEQGDFDHASQRLSEVDPMHRELGIKRFALDAQITRGLLALRRGDITAAKTESDGALEASAKIDEKTLACRALVLASAVAREIGDHAKATEHADAALKTARASDSHALVAAALVNASRLANDDADAARALASADESLAEARAAGTPDASALADAARAEALARAEKLDDADLAVNAAVHESEESERLEVAVRVSIARARVARARGDLTTARSLADTAAEKAHSAGALSLEVEARLCATPRTDPTAREAIGAANAHGMKRLARLDR